MRVAEQTSFTFSHLAFDLKQRKNIHYYKAKVLITEDRVFVCLFFVVFFVFVFLEGGGCLPTSKL